MIKRTATLLLFLLPLCLMAQPVNDDCDGLIDLGTAPACPADFFSNVNATPSDIGFSNVPSCFNGGIVGNDVWFAFTSSDTISDYTISVTGAADGAGTSALNSPQIALYRGACAFDNLAELACASGELGASFVELNISNLTPNITYYIRVSDFSATGTPNWGAFQICVDETQPAFTIDEGGATACSGVLYDSGGPDGDYQNGEDYVFTICPDQPHGCIKFTLEYYFIEPSGFFFETDALFFYDGAEISPFNEIANIGGFNFFGGSDGGGGGVCYEVVATSGCLTVRFTSDATAAFEGFAARWECSEDCDPPQPLSLSNNVSEEDIVDAVSTPAVTTTVTDIRCPQQSYATFDFGDQTDLGLNRGLLLTTGDANWAIGPNDDEGSGNLDFDNGADGDDDLDYLSTVFGDASTSTNACVIELDVFVAADELAFEYVFGSEEYPEFVNDNFNDIFAFLVSGPGIAGDPNMNNQQNIAILPNGLNTPVQINSVNNLQNWEFYRNNLNGRSLQYDGLTSDFLGVKKSLTARTAVQPCNTYQLKLAIADRGDNRYDSGVFVSELTGGTPSLSTNFSSGIDYLVEGCAVGDDFLVITLDEPSSDSTFLNVAISGTAANGDDYLLGIPSTVVFAPGQTSLSFLLTTLSDMEEEVAETIIITLSQDFGCGEVTYDQLEIELRDAVNVEIQADQDTVFVCANTPIVLTAVGASTYFWSPVNVFDDPTSASPTASPEFSQWVRVEGRVEPCIAYDSVYLEVVDPLLVAMPDTLVTICQGESVQLLSTNNVGNANLQWSPAAGLSDANAPNPVATPQVSTDYVVSVNAGGCTVSDTVSIAVTPFDFPQVIGDTTICQNYSVQLGSFVDPETTTTIFQWSPAEGLDNDAIAHPIATPEQTTTYTLEAESMDGACSQSASVTITVLPADVQIVEPGSDTLEICLGETVALRAQTSTGSGAGLVWSSNDPTLSDTTGLAVQAMPEVSHWYFAAFQAGTCMVFDSVFVRVDSLPSTMIMADPDKEVYCQGEIVTLTSPVYEPNFYPDIMAEWLPGPGQETADSLWNMVLTVTDTFLYQRVTLNRGCADTSEILLNVQVPPSGTITPADTLICSGNAVTFSLSIEGQYESFEWMGQNLSCTDCFNPTATPAAGAYSVRIEQVGCDFEVGASVRIAEPPTLLLNANPSICPGSSIELNLDSDENSTYTWTATDPSFSSNEPRPVVSPSGTTTYFVVADNGVCPPVEDEITITIIDAAVLNGIIATETTLCLGEETVLTANINGDVESDIFQWTGPDGEEVGTGKQIAFPPQLSGTYTLTYISSDECGTQTATIDLEVVPLPVTGVIADTVICLGQSVTLNLATDSTTTYTWTSTDPLFSDFNTPAPMVSPTQTATYTLVASNGVCDDVEVSVTVQVIGEVVLEIIPDALFICRGDTIGITAEAFGGSDQDTFDWSGSDGTTYTGSSIMVLPTEATVYTLNYTSGGGCTSLTDSVLIEVEGGLVLDGIRALTDTVSSDFFEGDDLVLVADYTSIFPADELQFIWRLLDGDPGTVVGSGFGLDSLSVELLEAGDLVYQLEIITPDGCSYFADVPVTVKPVTIVAPNTFTPNDDMVNDFFNFLAQTENLDRLEIREFKVYNRWGQLVYDNQTPETGWDGNFNGKPQPSEVYFYLIRVARPNGFELPALQGDVTLVR